MSVNDDKFLSYAEDFEKKEAEKSSNRGTGFTREYETIKW